MSGRSPSGVASLRARFEQSQESSTSPPSRGRSPAAGSVTSDNSRPISKVRISFVSVEGSGRMGDEMRSKEVNESEVSAGENGEGSKTATNDNAKDKPHVNGHTTLGPAHAATPVTRGRQESSKTMNGSAATSTTPAATDGSSDVNPDKPISAAQGDTPGMLPADPKDEAAVSGGGALAADTEGLGSILKGSPFEQDGGRKDDSQESLKPKVSATHSQPPKSSTQSPQLGLANGKVKDSPASKPATQPKSKASGLTASAKNNHGPTSAASGASSFLDKDTKAAAGSAVEEKKSAGLPVLPSNTESNEDSKNPVEPQTPTGTASFSKQSVTSKASPKPPKSMEAKKETTKDAKRPAGKPAAASKQVPVAAAPVKTKPTPSASTTKSVKRPSPTSPKTAFTKPRPKSPTRPTKLPAAATAPTAASAAKLDGTSANDKRSTNNLPTRDRISSNPAKSKPTRTSLPIGSRPIEKAKAPRPRQSIASSKASEGSFLDRMMRPTQSSSQKAHEKPEPKTPPRKQQVSRSKRVSEGSNKSKADQVEAKAEPENQPENEPGNKPDEAASRSISGPNEAPSTEGANALASTAAHTVPPTIPVS